MKKIIFFTTSRSEFALVNQLIIKLKKIKKFDLKLIVGGSHNLKNFGSTISEVKKIKIYLKY